MEEGKRSVEEVDKCVPVDIQGQDSAQKTHAHTLTQVHQ